MEMIEQNDTENDELWNAKQMKYIKSYILNIKLFIIERHSNNDVFLLWKIKENNII